ncbi:hypothetical protein F0562_017440 [Nyssa sinensis]|uniref:Uncharacterized protein n=1 Tax=Nyssa sinensis TaxID=561372 RepID=A0A5J4ZIR9_9ASTE|nr:hypothetical protein F0562_017440 [Nyssa sinensis]
MEDLKSRPQATHLGLERWTFSTALPSIDLPPPIYLISPSPIDLVEAVIAIADQRRSLSDDCRAFGMS